MTKVKICGITSIADAMHAARSGADAIGLVFYEPSPRNIADIALAADIAQSVGPFVNVVALFVDPGPKFVEKVLKTVAVNCLQFHGDETPEFCDQFSRPFLKAIRMRPEMDVVEIAASYCGSRGTLLDSYVKGVPGGTGESFNWDRVPSTLNNIVLAGGLNAKNVSAAIAKVKPYAVDVSGGVEAAPGKKDPKLVELFIKNAKVGVVQ